MITLPHAFAPNSSPPVQTRDDLTVTFAKYHGHCYRIQMDPTDPLCTRSFVVWEPAFLESQHPLSLEQSIGLNVIGTIVQMAYTTFREDVTETAQYKLHSSLMALESEAIKQRVFWIKSPDLSYLWHLFSRDVIQSIFSHLRQHDVLQLRGVCTTWRNANEKLWKVWHVTQGAFFPEEAAKRCLTFREFRECKENYTRKMIPYKGAPPKYWSYDKGGETYAVSESHGMMSRIEIKERATGKIILTDSLDRWFFLDGFIVGHDVKEGTLKIYDTLTMKHFTTLQGCEEKITHVQQESPQVIATFSKNGILMRWDVQEGLLSTFDLSSIPGVLAEWKNEWMLFSDNPESTLLNTSQPNTRFIMPSDVHSFKHYENGFLIQTFYVLNRYVMTPQGLVLCWSVPRLDYVHAAGDIIVGATSQNIVPLNPKTGAIEKKLYIRDDTRIGEKIYIEGNKLFIAEYTRGGLNPLHVIDIITGEKLFHFNLPENIRLQGSKGDTLIVSKEDQLFTLDPITFEKTSGLSS